ncbi:hypothetical protein ALI22I_26230 [Saccharothrix sp. ALI-22-I]|uniref:hypothetical protein n=1 Tax=Saccharothrix sp. ALI-22-I TaxID=1933778 RepID=UPI00097BD310|nr:hypothetical protein [Saccharothrix sp. ALI-22-I]ONI86200.1 hypothetical protein ALI22I_26230 [Saccharothrix sp. ALI-22-I]
MSPLIGSMMRAVLLAVVVAAGAAFVLNRVGAPWLWAVLIALPIGALALLVSRLPRATDVVWSPQPANVSTATSAQASSLASRFAEAAVDQDRFANRVQPRLRRLAEARLRQVHGIYDIHDPRAREVLGADLHRLLTDPKAPLPEPSKLADLLENL